MRVSHLTFEDFQNPLVRDLWEPISQEFFTESGYPGKFNMTSFWSFWTTLTGADMGRFFTAYGLDGKPAGAFGAMFTPDPLTGNPSATEHFWFVSRPFRRSGKIALSLFNAWEDECNRRGVKTRWMAHIVNLNEDTLARFYRRNGYKMADRFFRKDTF